MPTFRRILSVICTGMVACALPVAAQTVHGVETVLQARAVVQVKGVVYDTSDQPIVGATVVEMDAPTNGTLTGNDGAFSLSVAKGASLKISYIGYKTTTVKVVEGRPLKVVLVEDAELLNDVVVMGYGTQRK